MNNLNKFEKFLSHAVTRKQATAVGIGFITVAVVLAVLMSFCKNHPELLPAWMVMLVLGYWKILWTPITVVSLILSSLLQNKGIIIPLLTVVASATGMFVTAMKPELIENPVAVFLFCLMVSMAICAYLGACSMFCTQMKRIYSI